VAGVVAGVVPSVQVVPSGEAITARLVLLLVVATATNKPSVSV
jgi:hypothetical protein